MNNFTMRDFRLASSSGAMISRFVLVNARRVEISAGAPRTRNFGRRARIALRCG